MKLPEHDGKRYVSASLLRTYGSGGMPLAGSEAPRGCPAKYKARYHDKTLKRETSAPLTYGLIVHEALRFMEEKNLGPEEALAQAWAAHDGEYLTPEWYQEALEDLRAYVDRASTPLDRYMVLASEKYLEALLYVDPEYGEIWYRGYLDTISLDPDQPALVHMLDWKTNRTPPSIEDVKADIQLKGNAWLVYENAGNLVPHIPQPRVIVHLDAIKWRELDGVYYTPADMEAWYEWTVALVKRILRDDQGEPHINEGCAYCPLRDSCPAYLALPSLVEELAQVKPADRDFLVEWRDRLNAAKNLADRAVKDVDARFKADAAAAPVVAGGYRWAQEPNWQNRVNTRSLHRAMGEPFYDLVTTSKTAVERAARGQDPETASAMRACCTRQINGMKIERRAIEE